MIYPSINNHIRIPSEKDDIAVFVHANGYTPECYKSIFKRLNNKYTIDCFLLRPLCISSQSPNISSWGALVDDLELFDNCLAADNPVYPAPTIK